MYYNNNVLIMAYVIKQSLEKEHNWHSVGHGQLNWKQ